MNKSYLLLFGLILLSGCNSIEDQSQISISNDKINSVTTTCIPNWSCAEWNECSSSSIQTRTCTDSNNCNLTYLGSTSQSCIVTNPFYKEINGYKINITDIYFWDMYNEDDAFSIYINIKNSNKLTHMGDVDLILINKSDNLCHPAKINGCSGIDVCTGVGSNDADLSWTFSSRTLKLDNEYQIVIFVGDEISGIYYSNEYCNKSEEYVSELGLIKFDMTIIKPNNFK